VSGAPDPTAGAWSEGIRELAYAKLNLVLQVGHPNADGMHPLCSLFASIGLADTVHVRQAERDAIHCPGVEGPNLALKALAALRAHVDVPPLEVHIDKRIPVAAGLGGGSADAAAVLRAANAIAGTPLDSSALRRIGAALGSDVPSQVEPRHALVEGIGERVEPVELPALAAVLVPNANGLSTATVYAAFDRIGDGRERFDPELLRRLGRSSPKDLAAALDNDLQPAALGLRPELAATLSALRETGALGVAVSGSGPTCFGLYEQRGDAERAAARLATALVAELRTG
jgi:4-diphosphocytidyl-2-C-methyl-D-erythritol kinase